MHYILLSLQIHCRVYCFGGKGGHVSPFQIADILYHVKFADGIYSDQFTCLITDTLYTAQFAYTLILYSLQNLGPSKVRALPMAAGRNIGGHYKWHFFLFSLSFSPAHC
jgi:hypothetical protein